MLIVIDSERPLAGVRTALSKAEVATFASKKNEYLLIRLRKRHAVQIALIIASQGERVTAIQGRVSNRIINRVGGSNRVVPDASGKPQETIEREWEDNLGA